MLLRRDTYVVLDIPEPFATRVRAIRARHDPFRAALPVEVTLIGSGGQGPIHPTHTADEVVSLVAACARRTGPLTVRFGPARRFPASDVVYFSLEPEAALCALHSRLAALPLRRRPSPFAFVPHCTLSSADAADATVLLAACVPGSFVLDRVSIYTTDALPELDRVATLRLAREGGDPLR